MRAQLRTLKPSELFWGLNFQPVKPWPSALPIIAASHNHQWAVVAGFERQTSDPLEVLTLSQIAREAMEEIWPADTLKPFEKLRFQKVLGLSVPEPLQLLLQWPLEFQQYADGKQMALKGLQALEFLGDWKMALTKAVLALQPTGSQLREIFDLLCDLKLSEKNMEECLPRGATADSWIKDLKGLRNPQTLRQDALAHQAVGTIAWPKGIYAKWERRGDKTGLSIQAHVSNSQEWNRLRDTFAQLDVEKKLWKN